MKTPYELFGDETRPGWKSLIEKLFEDMKAAGWDGEVFQIKEKFGGLRVYIGKGNDEVYKLIDQAEKDSYKICEECGKPGVPRNSGWIKTLCDEHGGQWEPLK